MYLNMLRYLPTVLGTVQEGDPTTLFLPGLELPLDSPDQTTGKYGDTTGQSHCVVQRPAY